MADVVVEQGVDRPRLSWGAIFGGAVTALGLWVLLYAFGLAVGLSSLDPAHPHSARASGIFTGIWALIAPLIALFVGGWVAGRGSGILHAGSGRVARAGDVGADDAARGVDGRWSTFALVGGAVSVGKAAVSAGGSALGAAITGSGGAARWMGIDANDALGPINERLSAEGRPTITAEQLQAGTRDVVQSAVREGQLDRETLIVRDRRQHRVVARRRRRHRRPHRGAVSGRLGTGPEAAAWRRAKGRGGRAQGR